MPWIIHCAVVKTLPHGCDPIGDASAWILDSIQGDFKRTHGKVRCSLYLRYTLCLTSSSSSLARRSLATCLVRTSILKPPVFSSPSSPSFSPTRSLFISSNSMPPRIRITAAANSSRPSWACTFYHQRRTRGRHSKLSFHVRGEIRRDSLCSLPPSASSTPSRSRRVRNLEHVLNWRHTVVRLAFSPLPLTLQPLLGVLQPRVVVCDAHPRVDVRSHRRAMGIHSPYLK